MQLIKDISNWFFYKKQLKIHSVTSEWKKFNIRIDWIKRLYTVVSIDELKEIQEFRDIRELEEIGLVLEKTKQLNSYLYSINLGEIITPTIKKIDNSESYLLYYSFFWKWWSWKKILIILSFAISLIIIGCHFNELKTLLIDTYNKIIISK